MYKLLKVDNQKIKELKIGLKIFEKLKFKDIRGSLDVSFEGEIQLNSNYVSIKSSFSKPFIGRGLHHQSSPFEQDKIISIDKGKILDFSFDTTKKEKIIYCIELDETKGFSLSIPSTFAHGFITLEETVFNYTCFGKYNEAKEDVYNLLPNIATKMGIEKIIQSNKDSSAQELEVSILN